MALLKVGDDGRSRGGALRPVSSGQCEDSDQTAVMSWMLDALSVRGAGVQQSVESFTNAILGYAGFSSKAISGSEHPSYTKDRSIWGGCWMVNCAMPGKCVANWSKGDIFSHELLGRGCSAHV